MASFAGVGLGVAVSMQSARNPLETQINTYPGVNNLEALHLGTRGGTTAATGRLFGTTPADLATAEATLRALCNGATGTLIDTFGVSWVSVRMEEFKPEGRVQLDPDLGFTRRYQARFLHLA
jgi:hypothetical protein